MRTHGWGGHPPSSDEEAVDRILDAARPLLDRDGTGLRLADLASELNVTRQTVYRYFPGVGELIGAAALRAAVPFINDLSERMKLIASPGDAVVDGLAVVVETLPNHPYIRLALDPVPGTEFATAMTSNTAKAFSAGLLRQMDVDWENVGFDGPMFDQLVEHGLRILQSLVLDPGDPPRTGTELREYLTTWMRPAVDAVVHRHQATPENLE